MLAVVSVNIDECEPVPCGDTGDCEDGINEYICHCHPGWAGPRCTGASLYNL